MTVKHDGRVVGRVMEAEADCTTVLAVDGTQLDVEDFPRACGVAATIPWAAFGWRQPVSGVMETRDAP